MIISDILKNIKYIKKNRFLHSPRWFQTFYVIKENLELLVFLFSPPQCGGQASATMLASFLST